jgi:chemotaxis protein CheY-P-specific phosphatase CheC
MKKARERLDKIMVSCRERMQEEVSALLGKVITFAEPETKVLTKEDFFSEPAGKSVLAHVQLEGDIEGHGCLLVPIRDAIRIGGTLIMLPDSELESVISEEEYTEELEDSYGEIANIICGSLTSTFEEQFPKNFRLVRTEQEVILPVKVEIESDQPVPDGSYYVMTSQMSLEGTEMGKLQLLLPAASFGLVEEPAPEEEKSSSASSAETVTREQVADGDEKAGVIEREEVAAEAGPDAISAGAGDDSGQEAASPPPKKKTVDVGKQKAIVDQLLAVCQEKIGEEVGALLGGALVVTAEDNQILSKEELLEQAGGKQVLARMDVRGDGEGESFLMVSLKDAIFLGGTLIMLPEAELDEVVLNEEFGEDAEDAYGEIANIIAGVYTAVFEEQYRKNLGFVKTSLETIVPIKIDPESDEVLPNTIYYLNAGTMRFNDKELGRIQMAFPAQLLDLEGLVSDEAEEETAAGSGDGGGQGAPSGSGGPDVLQRGGAVSDGGGAAALDGEGAAPANGDTVKPLSGQDGESVDILLVTDDDNEAASISAILTGQGFATRILHFRDPVADFLTSSVSLVFLIMEEVNEQGFATAIKLGSSGLRVPLVMAGPAWTRSTVLKAVKYGATDILVTPSTAADVQEKLDANLSRKAA